MTAVNEDLIHTWQKGIVSRRYNRSSNKCRGNFFPPEPKESPRFDRALFPGPAFHLVEVAMAPVRPIPAPTRRPAYRRTAQLPDHLILRAKVCAGPAWRYKEDSQQSDRRFRQHFRAGGSSEIGPGRSSPAWRHFLARAREHHLKHQRPEPLP